ncbi:hypothetical protein LOTGIDRAFT_75171, partial [Lottia gigantea]
LLFGPISHWSKVVVIVWTFLSLVRASCYYSDVSLIIQSWLLLFGRISHWSKLVVIIRTYLSLVKASCYY